MFLVGIEPGATSTNSSFCSQQQCPTPHSLYSPPTPHFAANNSNTTVAAVLDTGNFVVQQLNPDGSTKSVLWQSFDNATSNCLLPGMKLGVNRKTGHNSSLVSWASEKSPLLGPFRLEWEPREGELIMRRRQGQVVWKSGKLIRNNNRFFENIPEESQLMYNYNIVSTKDENYFSFTTPYTEQPTNWKLFESGQLTGSDGKDIARADMCYGYNNDGGCQKWKIPSCRYPGYVFKIFQGMPKLYGENDTSYEASTSYGIGDCQARCWNSCSCIGFMSYNDDGTGCVFFSGKSLENVSLVTVGQKFYMLVKKQQHRGVKRWIWISALITTSLIICPSILCLAIKKRKHVLEGKRRMKIEMQDLPVFGGSSSTKDLKVFNYALVMEATNNFSSENKLGQGGFGPVYKGIISTGQEVAAKRLSKTSGQGIVEFKNELKLISELQHMNLIQLLGCCIHEQERMLIYEFMPNKSLDFFLFEGIFSTKSDVYSFGVLLLEIVSGRRNNSFYDDDHLLNLVGHAWELWNDNACLQLIDPSLNGTFVPDEAYKCIHVGLLCVQHYAKDRPNMLDIISMLTNKSVINTLPRRPAFYVGRDMIEGKGSSKCIMSNSDFVKENSTSTEVELR
ncbi:hypothetical protein RIF29_30699 [Crotalaria pallida]|uniref:non-specific serine/threonine protein kinase n=1 Tax=Crotalaria pallida TaxID=3830 RepID=A0AAN9EGP4_CROPI